MHGRQRFIGPSLVARENRQKDIQELIERDQELFEIVREIGKYFIFRHFLLLIVMSSPIMFARGTMASTKANSFQATTNVVDRSKRICAKVWCQRSDVRC